MVYKIVAKHARRIAQSVWMLPRFRVKQYSRRFKRRGGDNDDFAEDFLLLTGDPVYKRHAFSLTGVRVHCEVAHN